MVLLKPDFFSEVCVTELLNLFFFCFFIFEMSFMVSLVYGWTRTDLSKGLRLIWGLKLKALWRSYYLHGQLASLEIAANMLFGQEHAKVACLLS